MKAPQNNAIVVLAILTSIIFTFGVYAASEPTAPQTLTRGASSTFDSTNYAPQQTDALAGNITFLTLEGLSQTRAWQGYYGNVTGWIVLDDANNNTFYNWTATEPRGQIYASLVSSGTPSWADVVCGIVTGAATGNNGPANFHTNYGIAQDDYDNVTITYNRTDHPSFEIINRTVTGCPTTYIYQSDVYQQTNFANFLLFDENDDANDSWVFGTTMENNLDSNKTDLPCYDGGLCDFQLLVAEDGHGTDTSVTAYYFWVDIDG